MKFDTSSLRRTSDSGGVFPWRDRDVPFIHISASGVIRQAQGIVEKRTMLKEAGKDGCLLAAWPGQWRQDIFVIDDLVAAEQGLEPPGR
jgi:hypothetical protein